ncbi:branched-chain amino acid transaminase [Rickettsia endosymbiont of Polydrusus tereticollis]|uniref:branched-chain amino acid transaminase n=1 Tax=Rickettsia endosymbiont of Polydrusus tereticollis TaxID=3066251 RepID=UPI0031331403
MTILQEQPVYLEQSAGYIWINGKLISCLDAKINVLTHSLHYSGAVFEGERAYNGKVFKLKEHTIRLIKSAEALKLQVPYSVDEIIEAHKLVIEKNNIKDAYVRPLIWCGSESMNISHESLSVNVMVVAIPSEPRFPAEGINVHISRWRKASPDSLPPQCKGAGHYSTMIVSIREATALGYDDAILLDFRGYIAEFTSSNIFFVKDNTLYTPIADAFLNGITRQTIIEIAKKLGIEAKEEYIKLEDIENFTECFATGTAVEIQKIRSIDLGNKKITFKDHKITDSLKKEYDKLVRQ